MALRSDLRIIGREIRGAYAARPNLDPDQKQATLQQGGWFSCRYCRTVYLFTLMSADSLMSEAAECFAHEGLCDQRPAEVPLNDREHAALETVYGARIRDLMTVLDWVIESEAAPAERARAVERRGVLAGELIRIGLPIDHGSTEGSVSLTIAPTGEGCV